MSESDVDGQRPTDFTALPEPIRTEDLVATKDTTVAPDPTMGRDTEKEFMLRNIG